jgi:hypothetical protein
VDQEQALKQEITDILEPYLDDQVMDSVFEAQQNGVKDLVIYLDLIQDLIYQLEREEVLKDPGAPAELKQLMTRSSREVASFGSEVPGYVSFWFVVNLLDGHIAAMACSVLPKISSGLN